MIKFDSDLLKKDIKSVFIPILMVAVYIIAGNFIMGKICPLRMFCGLPCPGCGLTRTFLLVFQGKFYEATIMHPFWIPIVLLLVLYVMFRYFIGHLEQTKKIMGIFRICVIIILILCIVYYIYRMITWFPYQAPMIYDPGNIINVLKNIFI